MMRKWSVSTLAGILFTLAPLAAAVAQPAAAPLGATPSEAQFPKVEFAFEARITLGPARVVGEAATGRRQYIPITGGTIAGPKLTGSVIPGGWDYQNRMASGCFSMTADYFLEAEDGTVIHILNESFNCGGGGPDAGRSYFRPTFEAPMESAHAWMNSASFVAALELDMGGGPPAGGAAPEPAIRIKFYQIK
jgi:hypothetical protein